MVGRVVGGGFVILDRFPILGIHLSGNHKPTSTK